MSKDVSDCIWKNSIVDVWLVIHFKFKVHSIRISVTHDTTKNFKKINLIEVVKKIYFA